MKVVAMVIAIILLAIIFLSVAVYVAPKCQPGQGGTHLGGMLIEGCQQIR
jgi:hypothetical protein